MWRWFSVRETRDCAVAGGEHEGPGAAGQQGGGQGEMSPTHRSQIRPGQILNYNSHGDCQW